eukprot:746465-Pleurochrysis_carterae.AAC.1
MACGFGDGHHGARGRRWSTYCDRDRSGGSIAANCTRCGRSYAKALKDALADREQQIDHTCCDSPAPGAAAD